MKRKRFSAILISALFSIILVSCFDATRDSVFDPGGTNYDPDARSNNSNLTTNNINMIFGKVYVEATYDYSGHDGEIFNFVAAGYVNGSFIAATKDNKIFESKDGINFRLRYYGPTDNNGTFELLKIVPSAENNGFYILYNWNGASLVALYFLGGDFNSVPDFKYLTLRFYDNAMFTYNPITTTVFTSIFSDPAGNLFALNDTNMESSLWLFDEYQPDAFMNSQDMSPKLISVEINNKMWDAAINTAGDYLITVGNSSTWLCATIGSMTFSGTSWVSSTFMYDQGPSTIIVDGYLNRVCYYEKLNTFFALNETGTQSVQILPSAGNFVLSAKPISFTDGSSPVNIRTIDDVDENWVAIVGENNLVALSSDPSNTDWEELHIFDDGGSVNDIVYANLNEITSGAGKFIIAVTSKGRIAYSNKD